MSGTAAERAEYAMDVAKAAHIRAQLLDIESRTIGPRPGQIVRAGEVDNPRTHPQLTTFELYGIPPPGIFGSVADQRLWNQLWPQYPPLLDRIKTLYGILFPPSDLSPLEEILSVVAIAALPIAAGLAAGTLTGAAAGAAAGSGTAAGVTAAGAGTAAASGAAAGSGVALSTVGTGAALTTTAGTLSEASAALAGAGSAAGAASAASAAATAGSLASDLGKGVSALTGSSTLGSVVSDIVGNVTSVVGEIEQLISPLTSFASKVLTGIDELNKSIIQPIAETVSKDYTTITGLISEVHTLAHNGIQGILAIPSALASAFSSLDAANQRLAALNAENNKAIAQDVLAPGIANPIASPLGDIHSVLNSAWNTPVPGVGKLPELKLDESLFQPDLITKNFNTVTAKLADQGVFGKIVAILVESFNDILGFLAATENLVEMAKQKGNQDLPVEPLGVEEVIDAWWKDHFDEQTALIELARHGIDETRARALYALKEWLPDPTTALTMFYKGVITFDQVNQALSRQGYSAPDIEALSKSILETVNPREAIQMAGRLRAASLGFLSQTLNTPPPDDIRELYPPRLARADIANFDWIGRWNIQGLDWWITAWFRGLATDEELKLAATALNVPEELHGKLAQVAGGTIQLWMIPDMLAQGLFTETEARDYLKFIGIEPKSVDVLIQYGAIKKNAGKGPDLLGLGKISDSAAKQMLEDGIIDKSEYNAILVAHGYSPQAASLMADLAEQQIDLLARKTYAQNLIQEYDLGAITLTELQAQLAAQGFTEREVQNYTAQAEAKALQKTKRLSNSDVKDFLKAGIFTEAEAEQTLIQNGWSPDYAQAFIALWQSAPTSTKGSGNTAPTNPPSG